MGDNKTFRVNVQTSTSKKINVTSNVSENFITASPDTGLYYSRLSEKWAIGNGLVENKDYSSKTYATQAKEYANESKMYSESANLDLRALENKINEYDAQLDETIVTGLANITTAESNAVSNIEANETEAITNIQTITNESITSLNTTKDEVLAVGQATKTEIQTTKTNAITDVKKAGDDVIEVINENGKSLPMFTVLWADHIYNDASYLRADTFSWHSADIYITAYERLLEEYYNEYSTEEVENGITYKLTPSGYKIADVSQQDAILSLYESNGKAWFYILDIANTQFKLPREKKTDGKYLYFYVGNYSRPDTEVQLGILTEIANGMDLDLIVGEINNARDTGVTQVSNATQTGLTSVSSAVTSGLNNISSASTTGVNNITQATNTGVSTINDTTNKGKAELNKIVADKIPPATVDTLGLVKPDGVTVMVTEDGTISSSGGVTLDTAQEITARKTFKNANCDIYDGSNVVDIGNTNFGTGIAFQSNAAATEFSIIGRGYTGNSLAFKYFDGGIKFNNTVYDKDGNEIKSLPVASTDVLGGVKVDGSTISIADGIISSLVKGGDEWEYSKGANSYIKHKTSGLTIQGGLTSWNSASSSSSTMSTKTITFPKAFGTTCCAVIPFQYSGTDSSSVNTFTLSKTSFSLKYSNYIANNAYKVYWIAFGY